MRSSTVEQAQQRDVNASRYISFLLDNQEFGIPITRVREIKELVPVVRVPNAPPYITGVINLRGTIVPILDLRTRLGLPQVPSSRDTGIIIVNVENRLCGLVVDRVEDVKTIRSSDIDKTPEFVLEKLDVSFIDGVARIGDMLLVLLDIDAVFSK
ncbi:MAG: chemotaxis protein CheW [Gemmatimonadetes bacterium]|nr:MAG: chemotaxis protein CheW [Gemmatimonadota bacterium]